MILLWWFGVYDSNSVWDGWIWPLLGWLFMPRLLMTLSLWRLFPDSGADGAWVATMCIMGFLDAVAWTGGES